MNPPESEEPEFGLQIAPLIDLLFVLLLFFMVTASTQAKESELALRLASQNKADPAPSSPGTVPITLEIDATGQVFYNKTPIDPRTSKEMPLLRKTLSDALAKAGSNQTQAVIVIPNGAARQERLIDVLNACNAAHVESLSFGIPGS